MKNRLVVLMFDKEMVKVLLITSKAYSYRRNRLLTLL